jgi:pentatricopeptide repeat protein
MGKMDEAIAAHQKLAELMPGWSWQLGHTYAEAGQYEEAEKILDELEEKPVLPFNG